MIYFYKSKRLLTKVFLPKRSIMNRLYIILVVWQIVRTESAVISLVEKLNLHKLSRYERSADNAATQTNLNFDSNCDADYKAISSSHSMCLVDVGTEVPLTQAEKNSALKAHNDYRKNVSPKATNMQKMVWDDELATIATKWAQQCRSGHDAGKARRTISLQDTYVGQNMAAGQADLDAAIKAWHDEVVDFEYGTGALNTNPIGHYTQVVQHMSARVGCGKASCSDSYGTYYICNYAIGQGSIKFPYKNGTTSCSDCPSSCNDNLCDCSGKLCFNTGTLDINACTCSCPSLYTGDQCQTLQCTTTEKSWCTTQYSPANCTQYSNFPIDCHMMCGVCPYPCDGKQCENGGTLDTNTCECSCQTPYTGPTCTETNCPGTEKWWCQQYYTVDDCAIYSNFPSDCNIMCGICSPPCDGKQCLNGGTLDVDTCSCSCVVPYTGSTCAEKDCSVGQKSWCYDQNATNCNVYSNFPSDCNILCGVCP